MHVAKRWWAQALKEYVKAIHEGTSKDLVQAERLLEGPLRLVILRLIGFVL